MFGLCGAPVDQVGKVVAQGVFQVANADADKAETRGAHLVLEQIAASRKYSRGKLRRRAESTRSRPDFEIGAFQLKRHGGSGQRVGFQTSRHALGEFPETLLEWAKFTDVVVECRFGRNA